MNFVFMWCICCVLRYNRTKIRWTKNGKSIGKNRNIKLSKKGALRILNVAYRDSATFACFAGLSMAELKLRVKPKPGERDPIPADYESAEYEDDLLNNYNTTDSEEGKLLWLHRIMKNSFISSICRNCRRR